MAAVDFNYTAPPTVKKFMRSNAFLRGIKGPIGSGKSVGCVIEILRRCIEMPPCKDGIRRSKWAVVRNTGQQLKDTTLKTFMEWVKPGIFGRWWETDKQFVMKFNDVEAEILFRPLDSPEDVQRVLSLELTGAWVNECREVPVQLIQDLQGRLRRYPPKKEVAEYWSGLICDTNPPEDESEWFRVFEQLPLEEGNADSVMRGDFFHQPSGLSIEAENRENLHPQYYEDLSRGKTSAWVDTYIHGYYSPSLAGKPVYLKSFRKDRHVAAAPLHIDPVLPVCIGFDTGRTPAMIFKQMGMDGRVRTLREAAGFDMGMEKFIVQYARPIIRNFFPTNPLVFVGDPAGTRRNDTDEGSAIKTIKAMFAKDNARVRTAFTNNPLVRIKATEDMLSEYPDGDPMMVIDPSCKRYIEGLRSKYRMKRVKVTGGFADKPDKNDWSHLVEAGQYVDMFLRSGKYDPKDYSTTTIGPFNEVVIRRPAQIEGY